MTGHTIRLVLVSCRIFRNISSQHIQVRPGLLSIHWWSYCRLIFKNMEHTRPPPDNGRSSTKTSSRTQMRSWRSTVVKPSLTSVNVINRRTKLLDGALCNPAVYRCKSRSRPRWLHQIRITSSAGRAALHHDQLNTKPLRMQRD